MFLKKALFGVLTILFLLSTTSEPVRADTPLPTHLQACTTSLIQKMMQIDRNDTKQLQNFFLNNIDADLLLQRAVGRRAAHQASETWRAMALEIYFNFLSSKGNRATTGVRNNERTVITLRLADRPIVRGDTGIWHIVGGVQLDNGNRLSIAALITDHCKVVDLSQGGWVSSLFGANEVDQRLRKPH